MDATAGVHRGPRERGGVADGRAGAVAGRANAANCVLIVLIPFNADDPTVQLRVTPFVQSLQQLGWTDGRNVAIDIRSSYPDSDRFRAFAAELVALAPDVLVTSGPGVGLIQQATRTIPIVFAGFVDPVGVGLVESLARPGGNVTGFSQGEFGFSGKWLE